MCLTVTDKELGNHPTTINKVFYSLHKTVVSLVIENIILGGFSLLNVERI